MDSISKYRLGMHEDGTWHVIDTATGGPAEIEIDGLYKLLYRMPKEEAEEWSKMLNEKVGMFSRKNSSR